MSNPFEMIESRCGACSTCNCGGACSTGECKCKDRTSLPAVLLVDDDADFVAALSAALKQTDRCRVYSSDTADSAVNRLRYTAISAVVADHHLPGRTGTDLLEHVRSNYPDVGRVIMTGRPSTAVLAGAINRARSHQYIPKSMTPERMVAAILRELPEVNPN